MDLQVKNLRANAQILKRHDWQADTGRRIHSQAAFCAWRAPGIIIEVGFAEMPRRRGLAQGRDVGLEGQPEGPIDPEAIRIHGIRPADLKDPEAIRIHGIRPADLKSAARFSTSLPRVKDFVGGSPIVAHAYKDARDFLYCEFARATVIQWGESAYAEQRYNCTRLLFGQLFPGALKSLTSMCDRPVPDTSERDDRHLYSRRYRSAQARRPARA
jgi:DNA polymerase-3 subunit epsilon